MLKISDIHDVEMAGGVGGFEFDGVAESGLGHGFKGSDYSEIIPKDFDGLAYITSRRFLSACWELLAMFSNICSSLKGFCILFQFDGEVFVGIVFIYINPFDVVEIEVSH